MSIRVYDYRTDIRNLEITPEIRSRFIYLEPHEVHTRHSHDLGHEVFLVLDGHVRFDVDGETVDLLAGQLLPRPREPVAPGKQSRGCARDDVPLRYPAHRADPHLLG